MNRSSPRVGSEFHRSDHHRGVDSTTTATNIKSFSTTYQKQEPLVRTTSPARTSTGGTAPQTSSSTSQQQPAMIVCSLCQQQFTHRSIAIHVPQCYAQRMKEWETQQANNSSQQPLVTSNTSTKFGSGQGHPGILYSGGSNRTPTPQRRQHSPSSGAQHNTNYTNSGPQSSTSTQQPQRSHSQQRNKYNAALMSPPQSTTPTAVKATGLYNSNNKNPIGSMIPPAGYGGLWDVAPDKRLAIAREERDRMKAQEQGGVSSAEHQQKVLREIEQWAQEHLRSSAAGGGGGGGSGSRQSSPAPRRALSPRQASPQIPLHPNRKSTSPSPGMDHGTTVSGSKFCSQCGYKIPTGKAKFCQECGHRLFL
eukprot:PhF_6_TR27379/c0_g1_i1/m.40288